MCRDAPWTISGVSESDGCTYETGFGISFKQGTVHRSCPNGFQTDVVIAHDWSLTRKNVGP